VSAPSPPADVVGQLRSLCGKAVRSLPASGAGLSVAAKETQHSLVVAADPASEHLEEMQFVLGEGPCVDASTSRRPVLVARLGDEGPGRWPAYTSAAQEAGVRAVFAFPLQIGAAQLGVMDFFRTREGQLSEPELGAAFAIADEAVAILLDGHDRAVLDADAAQEEGELAGPAELFQAQGMVMVQTGGTLAEAMARIRAHAYAENLRLIDVARAVVNRQLRFDRNE
jgi:GAF domain/ANTAR domain